MYWLFKLTTGKEGMGYGDFKLLAALGAWLGWQAILPIVLAASVIGAVVGLVMKFSGALREGPLRALRPLSRRRRAGRPADRAVADPGVHGLGLSPVRRIGLTGGIGSGKSTVAALLVECGAGLVDTDAIARALTAPGGAALAALSAAFGPELIGPDGALDRDRMRALAFGDAATKLRLEAVLHPMIGAESARQADALGDRCIVFDVPLLAESSHWRARVDRVLVVDCPEALQVRRVIQRSGWDEAAVRACHRPAGAPARAAGRSPTP